MCTVHIARFHLLFGWCTIQELFRRLQHERKLSENERHETETMLRLKTNKKIQDKLVS